LYIIHLFYILYIPIPNSKEAKFLSTHFFVHLPLTTQTVESLFRPAFFTSQTALTPSMSRMWPGLDSYSYELWQLASSDDEYDAWLQYVLGHALRILYVTRTHGRRSYELEQLASSDDTESDSYTYWVPLQRTDTFASIWYKEKIRVVCSVIHVS